MYGFQGAQLGTGPTVLCGSTAALTSEIPLLNTQRLCNFQKVNLVHFVFRGGCCVTGGWGERAVGGSGCLRRAERYLSPTGG